MHYDVFTDHLAKSAFVKKICGKQAQFVEWIVEFVSPIKRELKSLIGIIGKVARIYTIGYYENLNVVE